MRMIVCLVAITSGAAAATADALTAEIGRIFQDPARRERVAIRYELAQIDFIERIYRIGAYRPLWRDPQRRAALVAAIAAAPADGLLSSDYHHDHVIALAVAGALSPVQQAERDVLYTEAFARLAYHLRFGKANPRVLDSNWNFSRTLVTDAPAAWFYHAITEQGVDNALGWLRPKTAHYVLLKQQLAELRRFAAHGGWSALPAGPSLKPGTRDPRIALLRDRFGAFRGAALPVVSERDRFDALLEGSVRDFQQRHGLTVDGIVGKKTLAALNVPVEARIDQIRINLERIRWVFRDIADTFVAVNIAAFHAAFVRDRQIVWQGRAVVGRTYRQTPIFKATMTHIIFNPGWTVPPTILKNDVIPGVRKDPGYLDRKGLRLLGPGGRVVDPRTIDWQATSGSDFPYRLWQAPGPKNALGRVKFIFPNTHLVFLHDTPKVELFGRAERTFSSGCIRVERPLALAGALLDAQHLDPVEIGQIVDSGESKRLDLPQPVPVMLLYLTTFADPDGWVHFRRDVYNRDHTVLHALNGPFRFDPPQGYGPVSRSDSRPD